MTGEIEPGVPYPRNGRLESENTPRIKAAKNYQDIFVRVPARDRIRYTMGARITVRSFVLLASICALVAILFVLANHLFINQ